MSKLTILSIFLWGSACSPKTPWGSKPNQNPNLQLEEAPLSPVNIRFLSLPPLDSGIVVEKLTSEQSLDTAAQNNQFQIYRAISGILPNSNDDQLYFVDFVQDDPKQSQLYLWNADSKHRYTIKKVAGVRDLYVVYMNLLKQPFSLPSRQIELGTVFMPIGKERAYLTLASSIGLVEIANGRHEGSWAFHALTPDQAIRHLPSVAPSLEDTTSNNSQTPRPYCRHRPTVRTYSYINNTSSPNTYSCVLRPFELQECRETDTLCLGPAPLATAAPQDKRLIIDPKYFDDQLSQDHLRQYVLHSQAPENALIEVTFVARNIKANPQNNAILCRDKFFATAWSLGAQLNPSCNIVPAPSVDPVKGLLACHIFVKFKYPSTVMERNCYVSGMFMGELEQFDTIQIYKP